MVSVTCIYKSKEEGKAIFQLNEFNPVGSFVYEYGSVIYQYDVGRTYDMTVTIPESKDK